VQGRPTPAAARTPAAAAPGACAAAAAAAAVAAAAWWQGTAAAGQGGAQCMRCVLAHRKGTPRLLRPPSISPGRVRGRLSACALTVVWLPLNVCCCVRRERGSSAPSPCVCMPPCLSSCGQHTRGRGRGTSGVMH